MSVVPALLVVWLFVCSIIAAAILMQWYQDRQGRRIFYGMNGYLFAVLVTGVLIFVTFKTMKMAKPPSETPASQPDDSSPEQ